MMITKNPNQEKSDLDFAGIIATNQNKSKLIVLERTPGSPELGLPCGGIEEGEYPQSAAEREFVEETGIDLDLIIDRRFSIILRSNPHNPNSKIGQTFLYTYIGEDFKEFVGPEGTKVFMMDIDEYLDLCKYRSHDEQAIKCLLV